MLLNEHQEYQLNVIQANYSDYITCCKELFWYWLRSDPHASWYKLVQCLKSPAVELHTLAANIEMSFTGKYA